MFSILWTVAFIFEKCTAYGMEDVMSTPIEHTFDTVVCSTMLMRTTFVSCGCRVCDFSAFFSVKPRTKMSRAKNGRSLSLSWMLEIVEKQKTVEKIVGRPRHHGGLMLDA